MNKLSNLFKRLDLDQSSNLYITEDNKIDPKLPYKTRRGLEIIRPYAFYSLNNQPLALFFKAPKNSEEEKRIHRQVWNFNQSPVVFIETEQDIKAYNGFIFEAGNVDRLVELSEFKEENFTLWSLESGKVWEKYGKQFNEKTRVDRFLLDNIKDARNCLIRDGLDRNISNNLIGRLIFSRYLIDRGVRINPKFLNFENAASDLLRLIKNKKNLYEYFEYLGERFGGDLFPISLQERETVDQNHLETLFNLFSGVGIASGQQSLFSIYDFSIIPVELISNIYEHFIGEAERQQSKSFYTPTFLVDYVLSQTIDNHLSKTNNCKILDPSCGSGIFLVESLRKIISSRAEKGTLSIDELKKIAQENIFGVDKDENAINLAIFSIYLTLLDYQNPKDIETFKFPTLLNSNFFVADFFDQQHDFNSKLRLEKVDFILGNPPWGSIKNSMHVEYSNSENIPVSDYQIAQTFLARTKDFSSKDTVSAFVITSKILYNVNARKFREYFLKNFYLDRILELSAVRRQIFDKAIGPSAVVFYRHALEGDSENNIVHHISLKPNIFFNLFKMIVIERYDYKKIKQNLFLKYDWIWKVLLFGNISDFFFLRRIYEDMDMGTLNEFCLENDFTLGAGYIEASKNLYRDKLKDLNTIQTKEIIPYKQFPGFYSLKYKFPDLKFKDEGVLESYRGPHLIIRRSVIDRPIFTYLEETCAFPNTIFGISSKNISNISNLKVLGGLLSSRFITYFLFLRSSQWGVERDEILQNEYRTIPIHSKINRISEKLGKSFDKIINIAKERDSKDTIFSSRNYSNEIESVENNISSAINKFLGLSKLESTLIDYTVDISIPLFRGEKSLTKEASASDFKKYVQIFVEYYEPRIPTDKIFCADVYTNRYFTGINFKIINKKDNKENEKFNLKNDFSTEEIIKKLAKITIKKVSKELYTHKEIRGFQKDSFFILKTNEIKNWHPAVAYTDLGEFVDAIMKFGAKELNK